MIGNSADLVVDLMTEDDDEPNPLFPLAVAICLFAVSAFFSWQEFKYIVWGRSATAQVVRVKNGAMGDSVRYRWTDPDDGQREDSFLEEKRDEYSVGMSLDIEYLPGVMASRLAGTPLHHKIALVVFCLSLLAIIWYIAKLWRQGNRELAETAARESGTGPQYGRP